MSTRALRQRREPYRFCLNSDARYSAHEPLILFGKHPDEAVSLIGALHLDPVRIDAPGYANPLDLFAPMRRIQYPHQPYGGYLRIEAREEAIERQTRARPTLVFMVKLPRPTTVSRIGLLGNLLLAPESNARGSKSNFGLPRHLSIYAIEGLGDHPLFLPHPREWRKVFSSNDVRGLWGWTPIKFHPVHCRYLVFVMRDLPYLYRGHFKDPDKHQMEDRDVHGLSIQCLSIHAYEYGICQTSEVNYSPVSSWQRSYPKDFSSAYWQLRGIDPPLAQDHQSIYATRSSKYGGLEYLPSALIGLPSEHLSTSRNEWRSASGYSGDITHDRKNATSLVVQVIDDEVPYIEGAILSEKSSRGPENDWEGWSNERRTVRVFATEDAEVAHAPYPMPDKWKLIAEQPFVETFEYAQGTKILFMQPERSQFYRFELQFEEPFSDKEPSRRFALTQLKLLRSRNRVIIPNEKETYQVEQVQIRLSGPSLLDDHGFIDGADIMDLQFETSVKGRSGVPFLSLRSLLDLRERTRAQFICNSRQTRAHKQEFHERGLQGDAITDYIARSYGTISETRSKQAIDPEESLQHTATVTRQTMISNGSTDTNLPDWLRIEKPLRLLTSNEEKDLPGITTERNADLAELLNLSPQHVVSQSPDWATPLKIRGALQLLGDVLGISDLPELLRLPNLVNQPQAVGLPQTTAWSNQRFGNVVGIPDVTNLLGVIIEALKPWKVLSANVKNTSLGLPNVPAINIDDTIDLIEKLRKRLYPGVEPGNLPHRPSVSFSGSFGGQFFGGGSGGLSVQLDAGKSRSKSTGVQGQVNETLTYHRPENQTVTDTTTLNSDIARHSTRRHLHERDEEHVWKGQEVRYGREALDIVLATVSIRAALQPNERPVLDDVLRIRVSHLPPGVTLDVSFVGTAFPIPERAPVRRPVPHSFSELADEPLEGPIDIDPNDVVPATAPDGPSLRSEKE